MTVKPLERLWLFLRSRKLAVFLIAAIAASSALGMLVPQATPAPDAYNAWALEHPHLDSVIKALSLNRVFASWWFLLIVFMFFINLFACTWEQCARAARLWMARKVELPETFQGTRKAVMSSSRETLEKAVSQKGYSVIKKTANTTVFERNPLGIWAPVILHVGLIVVMLGGLVSAGFKMTGYMTVMEGEIRREVQDEYEVIRKAPFFGVVGHRGYGIGLTEQQRVLNNEGKVKYIKSDMVILDGNKPLATNTVEVGKPLIYKGLGIYEHNAGFAPLVTVTGSDGSELYKGFLFMKTITSPSGTTYRRSNFAVSGTPFTLNVWFYPDMLIKNNKVATRRLALGEPGIEAIITQGGQEIAKGVLRRGEKLNFAGNSLSFSEVRQWTGLEIIYDPGANILFAGCLITVLGITLLYLLHYRKLQLRFRTAAGGTPDEVSFYCFRHRSKVVEKNRSITEVLGLPGIESHLSFAEK